MIPISKSTTRKRLLLLADFLEKLPPEKAKHFDMRTWFKLSQYREFDGTFEQLCRTKKLGDCGTAACALGWGTQVPALKKAGLTVKAINRDVSGVIEKVFGDLYAIDIAYSDRLFFATEIKTPKKWAKHCRDWVKEYLPESPSLRRRRNRAKLVR